VVEHNRRVAVGDIEAHCHGAKVSAVAVVLHSIVLKFSH
jgi:hypothetical protein